MTPFKSRSLRRLLAVGGLAFSSAWLAGCGGGGGSSPPPTTPPPANASVIASAKSGEVLDYVKRKLLARGPQGGQAVDVALDWLFVAASTGGTVARTGTLVQEAGVDEDDLIKTDGTRIYTLQAMQPDGKAGSPFARLAIHTRDANGRPQPTGSALLLTDSANWMFTRGMQLASDLPRLAVIGESSGDVVAFPDCPVDRICPSLVPYRPQAPRLHVQLVDASQPAKPDTAQRLVIDGRLIGTRQIGRTLYLVATHTPLFSFDLLPSTASADERKAVLDRLSVADVLPMISVDGGPRVPLVTETDCWLQAGNASTQVAVTTITAIDLGSPTWARSSRCFAGGTEALYMSTRSVYLATTRNEIQTSQGRLTFAPEMRTDIHKFAIDGRSIAYRGSGFVPGSLGWDRQKSPYRMSEHNGDLRVLSFTGRMGWMTAEDAATLAASPATISVLRERNSDASLQTIATLPNAQRPAAIGKPGEQLYGVRFAGDRAYAVTFRQTDPLYVLDLSNPADPRVAGELQLPGFSDWLYPLDGGLLFGVGRDATAQGQLQGVKLAVFDVRDAANPRLLDSHSVGQRGSSTGLDSSPHGMAMSVVGNRTRVALPMLVVNGNGSGNGSEVLQTLSHIEIDHASGLMTRSALDLGSGWADFSTVRPLLLGNQLHLLRDGTLQTWDW